MSVWDKYPYTDFHELNLDWIIKMIKEVTKEMNDFKVVNRIIWGGLHDPGKEYPRWCIVDTPTHEGYISIKPVPTGITIDNEDYWRQVANYSALYADFQNRIVYLENAQLYINAKYPGNGLEGLEGGASNNESAKLQAILDYAAGLPYPRCVIFIPHGVYCFDDQINVPSYVSIIGEMKMATNILTHIENEPLFNVPGSHCTFKDLLIQCVATNPNTSSCFYFNGIQCVMRDCRIYNFRTGIHLYNARGFRTDTVYIETNVASSNGIVLYGACESSKIIAVTFYVTSNSGTGFNYSGGEHLRDILFDRCETGGRTNYGIILDGSDTTLYPGDILINDCIFDGILSEAIVIHDIAVDGGVIVKGCWFNTHVLTAAKNTIELTNCNNITIMACEFYGLNSGAQSYLTGVKISTSNNVKVVNNVFQRLKTAVLLNSAASCVVSGNTHNNDNANTPATSLLTSVSSTKCVFTNNIVSGNINYLFNIAALTYSIIKDNIDAGNNASSYTDATSVIADNVR